MMRTLRLSLCAAALLPSFAHAQYIGGGAPPPPVAPVPGVAESPSAALARHVRTLAASPRNYEALLGAGRAALTLGDPQAASGFFGRASEVNPRSWVPRIGLGEAAVHLLDPAAAMRAFTEAQGLGASHSSIALERGLAFDLLGQQVQAQSDYRVALTGLDPNEARRRLALSLAISGKRAEALATLDPLLAKRDPTAMRARAFVLALTGDPDGARKAVDAALPGLAGSMDPFLRRLAVLAPPDKAAAVHLGVIPGSGSALASVPQADRLGEIDQLLRSGAPVAPPLAQVAPQPVRTFATPSPAPVRTAPNPPAQAADLRPRQWLQLASGTSAATLPDEYRRLVRRGGRELFNGISPFVAEEGGKVRLLIGPFRSKNDAETFAADLASANIDAWSWTNRPGQPVRKLPQ